MCMIFERLSLYPFLNEKKVLAREELTSFDTFITLDHFMALYRWKCIHPFSSRGIHIIWNSPSLTILEITKGAFSLTMFISLANRYSFWLLGIYGPPYYQERPLFSQELMDLSAPCLDDNWILGGDFNVTRWSHEKSSAGPPMRTMFNSMIAAVLLSKNSNKFSNINKFMFLTGYKQELPNP